MCLRGREVIKHHNASRNHPFIHFFPLICTVASKYYNSNLTQPDDGGERTRKYEKRCLVQVFATCFVHLASISSESSNFNHDTVPSSPWGDSHESKQSPKRTSRPVRIHFIDSAKDHRHSPYNPECHHYSAVCVTFSTNESINKGQATPKPKQSQPPSRQTLIFIYFNFPANPLRREMQEGRKPRRGLKERI
jgi:hypothetical protein